MPPTILTSCLGFKNHLLGNTYAARPLSPPAECIDLSSLWWRVPLHQDSANDTVTAYLCGCVSHWAERCFLKIRDELKWVCMDRSLPCMYECERWKAVACTRHPCILPVQESCLLNEWMNEWSTETTSNWKSEWTYDKGLYEWINNKKMVYMHLNVF